MKVHSLTVGAMHTNCYIVYNENTKEAFVVDPADNEERIKTVCTRLGVKPMAILLTHGHFDHILAAEGLKNYYNIPIYAHEKEKETLTDANINLSGLWFTPYTLKADYYVTDREMLDLIGYQLEVIYTPGHTKGSCCYYIASEKVLLSGDTLFCESLGRTDFPGSSTKDIIYSICKRLFVLPNEVQVYPGHNEPTDIGHEKEYNPVARYYGRI
ncbi:MAG: MBL fold metallo-hydrolase [Lachnospiraceae bacterium]